MREIVLLSGKKGAGKDWTAENKFKDHINEKLAKDLKTVVALAVYAKEIFDTDITMNEVLERLEEEKDTREVKITPKFLKSLVFHFRSFTEFNEADGEPIDLVGVMDMTFDIFEHLMDKKVTVRTILQLFATDVVQFIQGKRFWVKRFVKRLNPNYDIVVTDLRFDHEKEVIKDWAEKNGVMVRHIHITDGKDEDLSNEHISERSLTSAPDETWINVKPE